MDERGYISKDIYKITFVSNPPSSVLGKGVKSHLPYHTNRQTKSKQVPKGKIKNENRVLS